MQKGENIIRDVIDLFTEQQKDFARTYLRELSKIKAFKAVADKKVDHSAFVVYDQTKSEAQTVKSIWEFFGKKICLADARLLFERDVLKMSLEQILKN